jgi:hypothetical protein
MLSPRVVDTLAVTRERHFNAEVHTKPSRGAPDIRRQVRLEARLSPIRRRAIDGEGQQRGINAYEESPGFRPGRSAASSCNHRSSVASRRPTGPDTSRATAPAPKRSSFGQGRRAASNSDHRSSVASRRSTGPDTSPAAAATLSRTGPHKNRVDPVIGTPSMEFTAVVVTTPSAPAGLHVSIVSLLVSDVRHIAAASPIRSFANVTLMGSAGSLHVYFCLRGLCL